jgi:ABC-type bacteriocin/lantibiotic exporter with double-glycine peptidase domain
MVLEYWGKSLSEKDLRKLLKTKPIGTSPINIYDISSLGFEVGLFQSSVREILSFLHKNIPPIVFIWREPVLHAVVVIGYNQNTDHWYINDPSESQGNKELDMTTFSEAWSYSNQLTATLIKKSR